MRAEPLGQDRRFNRYWRLLAGGEAGAEPAAGRLLVELAAGAAPGPGCNPVQAPARDGGEGGGGGAAAAPARGEPGLPLGPGAAPGYDPMTGGGWLEVASVEALEGLMGALERRGPREGPLHSALLRHRDALLARMRAPPPDPRCAARAAAPAGQACRMHASPRGPAVCAALTSAPFSAGPAGQDADALLYVCAGASAGPTVARHADAGAAGAGRPAWAALATLPRSCGWIRRPCRRPRFLQTLLRTLQPPARAAGTATRARGARALRRAPLSRRRPSQAAARRRTPRRTLPRAPRRRLPGSARAMWQGSARTRRGRRVWKIHQTRRRTLCWRGSRPACCAWRPRCHARRWRPTGRRRPGARCAACAHPSGSRPEKRCTSGDQRVA